MRDPIQILRLIGLTILLLLITSCSLAQHAPKLEPEALEGAYRFNARESSYPELYRRALERMNAQDFAAAEAVYVDLIEKEPRNPSGFIGLAASLIAQGRHQEAITAYNSALELSPDFVEALIGLGSAYSLMQDYERADEYYARAVALEPQNPNAHWGLALLLKSRGESEEAVAHLETVVEFAAGTRLAQDAQHEIDEMLAERP
jgi:tetratricopeptide (TPR) repeat protein